MCYLFKDSGKFPGEDDFVDHIVTEFGVDASSHDPGTPFRFEGRGQRGSVSHSRLDRVPV